MSAGVSGGSLSRRYARSLFNLAKEENVLDKFYQDVQTLAQLEQEVPETFAVLGNDLLDYNGRLGATSEISDRLGLHPLIQNFLLLLVKKDRVENLSRILKEFVRYRDEHIGIVRVELQQSSTPSQESLNRVEKLLEEKLKKKVVASGSIKTDMIGGMIIKVGTTIYDGSVKRELELLKEKMLRSEV